VGVPIAVGTNLTALGDTLPWVADTLRGVTGGRVNSEPFEPVSLIPALGVLDGTEFSPPTVDEQLGFKRVAQDYHLPGWHPPSTAQ